MGDRRVTRSNGAQRCSARSRFPNPDRFGLIDKPR